MVTDVHARQIHLAINSSGFDLVLQESHAHLYKEINSIINISVYQRQSHTMVECVPMRTQMMMSHH